jgi:serine phosphatase RsbU (regulator of sigma subunit)
MIDSLSFTDLRPAELPERLVEAVERIDGGPAACYVVDISGTSLRQVSGSAGLPAAIPLSSGIGPEFGEDGVAELRATLEEMMAGAIVAPLWVRGRATAMLVAGHGSLAELERLAHRAAGAVELATRYTDVFERARRHKPATAAAEIQQDLLGPRLSRVAGAHVAGTLLPAYEVGGDWFDHAENPEGVWLGVADAMGRGAPAAGISAIAVGACRAARRAGASLEQCCEAIDREVSSLERNTFVTAVLANWHGNTRTLTWINCGHPPPLLIEADGSISELEGEATHPLGLWSEQRNGFLRNHRVLGPGDRVLIYSDGVTDRRTVAGDFIGFDGLLEILRGLPGATAADTVIAIERRIREASDDDLSDDATLLMLSVDA